MEAETKKMKVVEASEVNPTESNAKAEKKAPLPKPIMLQDKGGTVLVRIPIDEKCHEKRYYRVASSSGATVNLENEPYRTRTIKCPINLDKRNWNSTQELFGHFMDKGYRPAVGFKI